MTRQDTYKHKGLRQQMCDELRRKGIADEAVLQAMNEVPRHWFIDGALDAFAYQDRALKIGCEQTISHPSTVAMQSQLLGVLPGMKVLEIGTGSGYQTAILLADLGFRARCFLGDGYRGLTEVNYGPYDRIIVTCGAREIPSALMEQMKEGGIMVIPLDGGEQGQEMLRITKNGPTEGDWKVEKFGAYSFVPMLDGRAMR